MLEGVVDRYSGSSSLVGRVTPTTLVASKRINYRNSFQTTLRATLADEDGSTRLRGRFGMHPVVLGFIGVWVLIVGSVAAAFVKAALTGQTDDWSGVLIPLGMLAFLALMVAAGRLIARSEQVFITEHVCRAMQCRV